MNVPLQESLLYNYTVKKPVVSGHQPPSLVLPVGSFSFKQMKDAVVDDWRRTNEKMWRFRGNTSTEWYFVYLIPDRIRIWKCWFQKRADNRSTWRKTSRSKGENEQKVNPHMARRRNLNPGHIGGRRVLSPLLHPCSPHDNDDDDSQRESSPRVYSKAVMMMRGRRTEHLPFSIFKMRPSTAPLVGGGVRCIFIPASSHSRGSLISVV